MKQTMVLILLLLGLLSQQPQLQTVSATQSKPKPNVLFIAVDDLNHWVKHLGRNQQIITPNLDRLARMGVTFTNAYCAAPVCNPSRAALMSGLRPSTSGVYDNNVDWRAAIGQDLTLVTHMRRNGYAAYWAKNITGASSRCGKSRRARR
jgi:arylsulfatase A-like enzyme